MKSLSLRWKRIILGLGLTAAAAGAGLGAYYLLVREGVIRYNKYDRRERGVLEVGRTAPDLALAMYDGSTLRLSSLWDDKPVFLVFGSCT